MNVLVDTCPDYLGEMINLKELIISYNCNMDSKEPDDLLPWLAPSLACGTTTSPLEELTLKLDTQFNTSNLDPLYDSALWSGLDRIFSSAAYPQFRILKIFLTVQPYYKGDEVLLLIKTKLASKMTSSTKYLDIVVS